MPSIPTNKAFIKFKPIWKLKEVPTTFIIKISTPPSTEFITNFIINFTGLKKLFQKAIIIIPIKMHIKIIFESMSTSLYKMYSKEILICIKKSQNTFGKKFVFFEVEGWSDLP